MKNNATKVVDVLKDAYRTKEAVPASDLWETRVMGDIRTLSVPVVQLGFPALFGRFVWHFAPIACLLIVVLWVALVNLDYAPEYEIAATFMANPIEGTLEQFWGV